MTTTPPGTSGSRILCADDLRRTGQDPRMLQRLESAGTLVRVRRGSYVDAEQWRTATAAQQHALRVLAAARTLPDDVFSHESAAAVWGIPIVGRWPGKVHVTQRWPGGGRSYPELIRHGCSREIEPVRSGGVAVTSAARTVVDLARSRPFACGVAAADHALRARLVTRRELDHEVEDVGSAGGRLRAAAVVAFADARAESVGESLSRARIHEHGLAAPELQVRLADDAGAIGRVDFWWPDVRLVGEFDGRMKYRTDGVPDPRAVEDRVWDEKLREDRLRAGNRRVCRWTWQTALDPDLLAARLLAAGVPRLTRRRTGSARA